MVPAERGCVRTILFPLKARNLQLTLSVSSYVTFVSVSEAPGGESGFSSRVRKRVVEDTSLSFRLLDAALLTATLPVPEPSLPVRSSRYMALNWLVKSLSTNTLHISHLFSGSCLDFFSNPLIVNNLERREATTSCGRQWPRVSPRKCRSLCKVKANSFMPPTRCPSAHSFEIATIIKPAGSARLRTAPSPVHSGRRNHLPGDRRCPFPDS